MNLMTNSMERLTKMLKQTDSKLKAYGVEPYGQRKATPKEKAEMVRNMTPQQFFDLVDRVGLDKANQLLARYEPKEGYGGNS